MKFDPIRSEPPLVRVPGGWAVREFRLGIRELVIWIPAEPDAFLEDPASLAAHGPSADRPERSDVPFWQYLWPAAETMARLVFAHDWQKENLAQGQTLRALELGAGLGLVGLAGLAAGVSVTFSDYQTPALEAIAYNARLNGFTNLETQSLDWNAPPTEHYPIILGSDVIYERAIHRPILHVLDRMLAPGGVAWLGDPGRSALPFFLEEAQSRGYKVEIRNGQGEILPAAIIGEFQLAILRAD